MVAVAIFVSGIAAFGVFAISFLDGRIWTWSDEVWNWTELAQKGPIVSATYYPAANNHVFLTVLQSFWPHSLIQNWPPLLRIWGMALQLLIVLFAALRLEKRFRLSARIMFVGLLFLALFCIPWMLDWTFYARGYPLATALLILLNVEATRARPSGGILSAAMILCVYTLPTMAIPAAYCGSFLFLLRVAQKQKGPAITLLLAGLCSGIVLLLLYAPILEQMADAARNLSLLVKDENPPLQAQFLLILQSPLYLALFVLVLFAALLEALLNKRWISLSLIAAAILSIWTFDFLADRGILGRPFLRNAHFFIPLLMLSAALSLVTLSARFPGVSATMGLLLLLFAGTGMILNTVPHWQNTQESKSPVRELRQFLQGSNSEGVLECAWFSEPSCMLVARQRKLAYSRLQVPRDGPCKGRIDAIKLLMADGRLIWFCGE